jgi:flavin reductase (DIM6/NTAB) family NADH-FMN oxidoreductase RutF
MKKRHISTFRPVYPSPAALITSVDTAGKPNIIALGEVFNISISKPVIVGLAIRKATYSHTLISETREFVVNLPPASLVEAVDACGHVSGSEGTDKFALLGLTALPAEVVGPPLVGECPVNIECSLLSIQEVGDHDLFLGEVRLVHADETCVSAEGLLDLAATDPLIYGNKEYYSLGRRIGRHGFSRTQ